MIFDVNIAYGVWPFRTTVRTVPELVKKLAASGIGGGWVHSLENIWNYDIDRCNQAMFKAWKKFPEYKVIPTLHEDYQRSLELLDDPAVPGGIIYSKYHNYPLESLEKIPARLQELNKVLLLPLRQEDERNQHPLARVAPVLVDQVLELCRRFPRLKVLVLNCKPAEAVLLLQSGMKNLYCDSAFIDGAEPYKAMQEAKVLDKILFGSAAPLLEPLASVMKMQDYTGKYDHLKNMQKFTGR